MSNLKDKHKSSGSGTPVPSIIIDSDIGRPSLIRSKTDSYATKTYDENDNIGESSYLLSNHSIPSTPKYRSGSVHITKRKLSNLFIKAKDTTAEYLSLASPSVSSYNLRTAKLQDSDSVIVDPNDDYGSINTVPIESFSDASVPQRGFYDDFTTVDWVHDTVVESSRRKALKSLPGLRGKLIRMYDAVQGWLLITIIAFAFTLVAYSIDACESVLSDLRHGYCSTHWFTREALCCPDVNRFGACPAWISWSQYGGILSGHDSLAFDFVAYLAFTLLFAYISVTLTLRTKTDIPLSDSGGQPKEKLMSQTPSSDNNTPSSVRSRVQLTTTGDIEAPLLTEKTPQTKRVIYSGTGSGVAEVKTILSGFIIRRFLGTKTLMYKSIGLIFSISSGMSVGKEGPYVHLAACVGNIACRLFTKFATNDIKRRQVISAATSAGVALAFGSPLGGVLFSLEEVSYYFLPHQLFRIFFCAMISALFLIFMDPYKTGKIVLFEVAYEQDWQLWELANYIFLGISGGLFGAAFCKFTLWWGSKFRSLTIIKRSPTFEVMLIASITGLVTFFNPYTSKSVSELLFDLASPCNETSRALALCPSEPSKIPGLLASLGFALAIKIILTSITFGVKVPAGIYVPSMVIGALYGRIFCLVLQYIDHLHPNFLSVYGIDSMPIGGPYAMAGAGAFLAGVTRMNITLATILFELTGSLNHVLPFSIAILVSNWVANAIQPESLYELLLERNNFPYLDNRQTRSYDSSLADLMTRVGRNESIDIGDATHVSSITLRTMTSLLQSRGDFDGCIPLVKGRLLVGVIAIPQLDFALDRLQQYCNVYGITNEIMCKLSIRDKDVRKYHHYYTSSRDFEREGDSERETFSDSIVFTSGSDGDEVAVQDDTPRNSVENLSPLRMDSVLAELSDLTKYIDRAPICLDIHSPLALVEMMFTKLGTRLICVAEEGKFVGILHRKKYIEFCHYDHVKAGI